MLPLDISTAVACAQSSALMLTGLRPPLSVSVEAASAASRQRSHVLSLQHGCSLDCRHLCQCLSRQPVLLLLGSQDRLQSVSSTRPHRSSPTPPSRWCSPAIIAQLSVCRHCLRRCQWMNSHAASPECCTRSSCRVRHAPLLAGTTVRRARQRVRHRAITTDMSTAMTCVSVCGGGQCWFSTSRQQSHVLSLQQ